MGRAPLTVVIPTRDEEANLADCLATTSWADEVVVIDSESRDRTVAIAREHGARVAVRPFRGYGDQRNFGAAMARHDWILCLDADERVPPALGAEIEEALARGLEAPGYTIRRRTRFAGRWIRHCGWDRDRVVRLYHRRHGAWDDRRVHERVVLDGPARPLASSLDHLTYRDLGQYAEKSRRYAERGAEELWQQGRRAGLAAIGLLPPLRFLKMYVLDRGFLDGTAGLVLCSLAAYGVFLKYARLWELGRTPPPVAARRTEVALSQELLDILACPLCKIAVHLTADGTGLACEKCTRVYPIRDDIPVMLVEEASLAGSPGKTTGAV